MGFHKRHIGNEVVHRLFKSGGASSVIDWYTRGVDALIVEMGLASKINSIINDNDWHILGRHSIEEEIEKIIREDLGIKEIQK
jgi:hypothetical protein